MKKSGYKIKNCGSPVRLDNNQETKQTCLRFAKWDLNQFVVLEPLV